MSLKPTFDELARIATKTIGHGCFLNTSANGIINSMTIGWGTVGNVWRRPIFTVMVRKSRYTHDLIEANPFFTVSIPYKKEMNKEIGIFGTLSGRDANKFEKTGLITKPAQKVNVPIIAGTGVQFECKVVYKQDMDPSALDKNIVKEFYGDNDYHTIYYGEVLDSYID